MKQTGDTVFTAHHDTSLPVSLNTVNKATVKKYAYVGHVIVEKSKTLQESPSKQTRYVNIQGTSR